MAGDVGFIACFITEGCLGMVIVIVEPINVVRVDSKRAIRCPSIGKSGICGCNLPVLVVEISLVEIRWKVLI